MAGRRDARRDGTTHRVASCLFSSFSPISPPPAIWRVEAPVDDISIEQFGDMLRGRLGLIVGPGITKYPGCLKEVRDSLAAHGNLPTEGSVFAIGNALLEHNVSDLQVVGWVRDRLGEQKKSSLRTHIVKVRWAGVLSAALDTHFEDDYRQYIENKKPNWPQVTTITDPMAARKSSATLCSCTPAVRIAGVLSHGWSRIFYMGRTRSCSRSGTKRDGCFANGDGLRR